MRVSIVWIVLFRSYFVEGESKTSSDKSKTETSFLKIYKDIFPTLDVNVF